MTSTDDGVEHIANGHTFDCELFVLISSFFFRYRFGCCRCDPFLHLYRVHLSDLLNLVGGEPCVLHHGFDIFDCLGVWDGGAQILVTKGYRIGNGFCKCWFRH